MTEPHRVAPATLAWGDIKAWRRARRAELVSLRQSIPECERKAWNEKITAALVASFDMPQEAVVGFCWPYKGEYDARFPVRRWREAGATAALPEVVRKDAPLQFRRWWPGAPMRPGVYDIPVPDGTEIVVPDVAIVPMNAYDSRGFRLGYGGGFFDSTLAAHGRRIVAIGVSYELLKLENIFPQQHDVPMDFVATEAGVYLGGGDVLRELDVRECNTCFAELLRSRGLPRTLYASRGYSSPACYAAEFPDYFSGEARENEGKG